MSKGNTRRIQLRTVVAFPAVCVALVISVALVLTPFGPAQGMTLAALPTPTETETLTATTAPPTTDATTAPTTTAPTTTAPTTAAPTTVAATTAPVPSPTPGTAPSLAAAPVDHHVLARIGDTDFAATYLTVDGPASDATRFQTFRVRFQLHNDGTAPITATPQLEYRPDGGAGFAVVPETPKPGSPLHLAREWVPSENVGTKQGPLEEDILAADFKMPIQAAQAVVGHHSMSANPDAPITLLADSATEQEFTVALSMDAKYLSGYELRVTDGGTVLAGALVARIVLGPQPAIQLSPGQRQGVTVDDPATPNAAGVVYPLMSAPAIAADPPAPTAAPPATSVAAVATPASPSVAAYPLASGSLSAAAVLPAGAVEIPITSAGTGSPHDMAAAQCGTCHRGHAAKGPSLLAKSTQSALCFSCHNGAAGPNVQAQYALPRPVNNPAAREYYSHDEPTPAVTPTPSATPTPTGADEFAGVTNRRAECADCHNSHQANGKDSTEMTDGWDASGRLAGVSGVSVENGAAGTAPKYTLLSGLDTNVVPANLVTREYQLCFKCHSGSTTLTSNVGLKPSKYALDKGVEFNPANPSFHPVEAQGTNKTTKMAENLGGTSAYKLWDFNVGSTIRCLNCHAGGATDPTATPPLPLPGSSLAPHTSSNRGILLENYRDRVLKPAAEDYQDADFGLCYVCHGEVPFANDTDQATNFKLHGKHLTDIKGEGDGGTDIDTAGDGQGNAVCAECHFRIHSTTNKVGDQAISGSRLVNFAPNVLPNAGQKIAWTAGTAGGGSCTLTCHGYEHKDRGY